MIIKIGESIRRGECDNQQRISSGVQIKTKRGGTGVGQFTMLSCTQPSWLHVPSIFYFIFYFQSSGTNGNAPSPAQVGAGKRNLRIIPSQYLCQNLGSDSRPNVRFRGPIKTSDSFLDFFFKTRLRGTTVDRPPLCTDRVEAYAAERTKRILYFGQNHS